MASSRPTVGFENKSFVFDEPENASVDFSAVNAQRRASAVSQLSRASYVTARNDDDTTPDVARYYYNETAPEQGFAQAAADGLKRLPSLLYRRRRSSRASISLSDWNEIVDNKQRRASRTSNLSHASYATAKNSLDAASYHYDDAVIADSLKRVPSLVRKPGSRRVSFADDLPTLEFKSPNLPVIVERSNSALSVSTVAAFPDNNNQLSKKKKVFLLFLLCTTNLFLAMCYSLIAPFFPGEMLRKGGTATLSGVVMSGYDFLRCFMSPVFGYYIYSIGPRFMLIIGPLVAAWCTILFGLLEKFPPGLVLFTVTAAVLRSISGVGNNAYVVVSIAIRPVLFAGFMSLAFGIIQASYTTGVIVGPAVGSVLYSVGGFGLPFYVIGSLTLLLTAIQIFAVPDLNKLDTADAQRKLENEAKGIKRASSTAQSITTVDNNDKIDQLQVAPDLRQPGFIAFCRNPKIFFTFVMYASFGFSLTFYSANLALHIRDLLGDNPDSKVGYVILIAGVTEVLVAPFAGLSLDYGVSATLAITVGYALNAVGLALIGPSPVLLFLSKKLWLVIVGSAIFGCGIGCALSAPYKLATQYVLQAGFPANQQTFGILAGCFASAYGFGSFLGPLTGGALHDLVGYPWASTIACAYLLSIMLLVIVTSFWARLRSRPS